jgi:hypothetical protein
VLLPGRGNPADARRPLHEDLQILDFMLAERIQPAAIERELVGPLKGRRDVCKQRKVNLRGSLMDVLALVSRREANERFGLRRAGADEDVISLEKEDRPQLCVPKIRFGVDASSGRRKLAS